MANNTNDFREAVQKRIVDNLTPKEQCFFAWLCAVRSLPFLSVKRHFGYWKENEIQERLQAVFYALDIAHAAAFSADAYAAAAAYTAAYAAYASSSAAAAAAYTAAYAAAYASSAAAAAAAGDAANISAIEFENLIFDDIEAIKNKKLKNIQNDISIYGELWQNFQKDLASIGCGYWGDWYADLFAKGFILGDDDRREIDDRIKAPKEYREQGATAVGQYMERLSQQGGTRINETRIIILGEKGAGKTCLAHRLKNPDADMTTVEESTEGVETSIWDIYGENGGSSVKARIWDFAGHVVTHSAHRCFLSERCLYVIVYDGRTELHNRLEYWLSHVQNYGTDSPVLILVNLRDDNNPPRLLENDLKRAFPFIRGFAYVNIYKAGEPLENFRKQVTRIVLENPSWNNQVMPAGDFNVKEQIEKLFDKDTGNILDQIPRYQFDSIASKYGIEPERIEEVLSSLTQLGASLWYSELSEYKMVVLNPDWITNGIYKIINWGLRNGRHRLNKNDFADIFKGELERYPENKAEFIFKLMNKYELAYIEGEYIIVPSLLGDMPDKYLYFEQEFDNTNSLLMEYRAEARLPENIVSRLIVRVCKYVKNEGDIWLKGTVLHYEDDTVALILEESETRISIRVKGKEQTAFISLIRETINNILDTYRSAKPEPWYRILGHNSYETVTGKATTIMKSEQDIVDLVATGQDIPVPGTRQTVSTVLTVIQYNLPNALIIGGNLQIDKSNTSSGDNLTISSSTYNFQNCMFNIAGDFRSLAKDFRKEGFVEEADILEETAVDAESNEKATTVNDVKKSGILSKARMILGDALTQDTALHKKLKTAGTVLKGAAGLYKQCTEIFGWPTIPGI